jgi:sugar/nucleoside kinase (ribokinase family)
MNPQLHFTIGMNISKSQVICCGHAAYDLNFMMEGYPEEDQKYKIDRVLQTSGGPAANAASLLSAWGINTAYAGLLGEDLYGKLILDELKLSGVDTALVQVDRSKSTPISAVIVNAAKGSRTLLNRRDELDQPTINKETVRLLRMMNPAVLHFDGHALDLSLKMIELFPDAEVVIDAGSYRPATDRLCAVSDFVICSRRFAEDCTGIDDITSEAGRRHCFEILASKYPGRIVVTLGADGLFYGDGSGKDNVKSLPAYEVKAIDTTGAGDIFHGAFSYGLITHLNFEDNLRLASAAGALSVTKPGARTSIPSLKDSKNLAGL